jgi:hypothetical protein
LSAAPSRTKAKKNFKILLQHAEGLCRHTDDICHAFCALELARCPQGRGYRHRARNNFHTAIRSVNLCGPGRNVEGLNENGGDCSSLSSRPFARAPAFLHGRLGRRLGARIQGTIDTGGDGGLDIIGERPCVFTALSESLDGLATGNRMADRHDGPVPRPACHRADGCSFGTAIDRCDPVEHDGDDSSRHAIGNR